jgi:hypothetical protein
LKSQGRGWERGRLGRTVLKQRLNLTEKWIQTVWFSIAALGILSGAEKERESVC